MKNWGLDFSHPPVYNGLRKVIRCKQDLMPSVIQYFIEIASLTLDGTGCYFLLCRIIYVSQSRKNN